MGFEGAHRKGLSWRAGRLVPAVAVIIGSMAWASTAGAATGGASALHLKGAAHAASTGGNLVDNGGKVLPASDTYAVFWGPANAWSSDVEPGITSLFNGFNGSNYLAIAQQYMRGSAISSTFEGIRTDSSSPARKVSPSTLGSEVQKIYGSNLDPNGIYFVYTSNFPSGGGFCAWHAVTSVAGQKIAVAYMPNTGGVAGCNGGNQYGTKTYSEDLYSLANVTAHEFMESVTDTLPATGTYGWIDRSGSEIGDKCAWMFSGSVTLGNSSVWQLQQEWSNQISGCAQGQ